LNFLAFRFENSWQELDCKKLIGIPSPIVTIIDPNNDMVISNNLLSNIFPTSYDSSLLSNDIFVCGNQETNLNCLETCPNRLDNECVTPGFKCFKIENISINCNIFNFCGKTFDDLNCDDPCPLGFDSECVTIGGTCFKDTKNTCDNIFSNNIQIIVGQNFTNEDFIPSSSINTKFNNIILFFSSLILVLFL